MAKDDRAALLALDRVLDEDRSGRPRPSHDLDPGFLTAVHRLRALHDISPPNGARERVWQGLTVTAAAPTSVAATTIPDDAPLRPLVPITPARPPKPRSSGRWHPYAELAAVAAILVTLLGGYAVGYRVLPVLTGSRPPTAPPRTTTAEMPMAGGNAARTGEQPGPGPNGPPELRWQFQTGGPIRSQPVIANGLVYVGSGDSHLYAIDAETGIQRWLFILNAPDSSPAVVDDVLYIGGEGIFYALDAATGKERWHVQDSTLGLGHASPAIMDDTLYVAGAIIDGEHPGEGALLALDLATGKERWRFPTVAGPGGPAVANGVVYLSADNAVYAVDAVTGKERWRMETGIVLGTPAVVDGTVYVSGLWNHVVIALDAATGKDRWRVRMHGDNIGALAVADGIVYVTDTSAFRGPAETGAAIAALDAATGAELWRASLGDPDNERNVTAPTVADGRVYAGDLNVWFALDAATGAELWRFPIGGGAATPLPDPTNDGYRPPVVGESLMPPTVADGIVYVAAEDGNLYAIGGAT